LAANAVAGALRFKSGTTASSAPAALATAVLRARFLSAVGSAALIVLIVAWIGGISVWAGRDYLWPAPKTDWEKIQGEWTLVSFKFMGEETPGAAGQPVQINTGQIVFDLSMGYRIDPTPSPRAIDVILPMGNGPGQLSLGIYKLTDDRLTLALAEPGQPRPAAFDDPAVVAVIIFDRVKR
jgi:uncharacterized protein (TIGR03067 family)